MKGIGYSIALLVLAGVEVACYLTMKHYGFSTPMAAGATFGLCITLFVLGGCMVLSQASPYGRVQHQQDYRSSRNAPTTIYRSSASVFEQNNTDPSGYSPPLPKPIGSSTHIRSDAFRDELQVGLEEKRELFARLLAEGGRELARFDYGVLKSLEKNSPGSIQGVITAKKVHHALEIRFKEIERFLKSLPITDNEKGRQLLHGDLEIPDDKQLTSVFRGPPIPPVKISEIEFHLRVLLKRISRRRSIFRARALGDMPAPELPEDGTYDEAEAFDDDLSPDASPAAKMAAQTSDDLEEEDIEPESPVEKV